MTQAIAMMPEGMRLHPDFLPAEHSGHATSRLECSCPHRLKALKQGSRHHCSTRQIQGVHARRQLDEGRLSTLSVPAIGYHKLRPYHNESQKRRPA